VSGSTRLALFLVAMTVVIFLVTPLVHR